MIKRFGKAFYLIMISYLLCAQSASAVEMKKVDMDSFPILLNGSEEVKFIFVFTSWCGVCKAMFSKIIQLNERYKNEDNVKIVILAIDDKVEGLQKFMNGFLDKESTIYYTSDMDKSDVMKLFNDNKIGFKGRIPHMTIFYKDEVVGDDIYEVDSVQQMIDHVLSKR